MALSSLILDMPRTVKRLIVLTVDSGLCVLTVWLAFYLRLGETVTLFSGGPWKPEWAVLISIALALPIFISEGLYRMIFRYSSVLSLKIIFRANIYYAVLFVSVVMVVGIPGIPRTIGIIQPILLLLTLGLTRVVAHYWLSGGYQQKLKLYDQPNVLIYGAGSAGCQLAEAIANSRKMHVMGFLDDDTQLHGQIMSGLPVFDPGTLPELIHTKRIRTILLALPALSRSRRHAILNRLAEIAVAVRTLPDVTEWAHGPIGVADLRDLAIEDLLDRDPMAPDLALLGRGIAGRTVLVTGAGGSIGRELCRQILSAAPAVLLLVELNEFALYEIHQELLARQVRGAVRLVPLLASVRDERRMREILADWRPVTVYHAAAYKHVPLVEANPAEGIRNNLWGTLAVARAAAEYGVSAFVLISTDKAVRPTNVMGASKRLAEMVLQGLAANGSSTCYSIVRFGNVLGSSGSVVPSFLQQIRTGGPLTLTHPEMIRYFMTIPEAAQLVMQAGAMATGGDVFVLDMGEPVKIMHLARRMIQLSGLSVRDASNPNGDIEIRITGLRPGEKLYEELLIGDDPQGTEHPRIMKAHEPFPAWSELLSRLERLEQVLETRDEASLKRLLCELVPGYRPGSAIRVEENAIEELPPDHEKV